MTTQKKTPAMQTRSPESALPLHIAPSPTAPSRMGLLTAVLLLCNLVPALAQAPSIATDPARQHKDAPSVEEWIEQASAAMTGGDYAEAARLYSIAQIYAQEAQDMEAGKVIPFYIALAYQRQADGLASEEQARNLRERAMMVYAAVLRSFPSSAAVYNNLAQLHLARGNTATALQMAGYAQQLASADDPDSDAYACLHRQLSAQQAEDENAAQEGGPQGEANGCQPRLSENLTPQTAS